jgi:predicted HicB family RNase H-like nuclease
MKNNNVLKYKNYVGSIEYDLTDKCLFGKILFIDDLITYEGNTIEELEKSFKEMVDDYLETCKLIGKEPQKAYSGNFNIRTTPEIHQALAEIAKIKNISLNKLIVSIFNNFVEDIKNKNV